MKGFMKSLIIAGTTGASLGFAYGLGITVVDKISEWWDNRKRKEVFDVTEED